MSSDILWTLKGLLGNPVDTLKKLRDAELKDAIVYMLVIVLIYILLATVIESLFVVNAELIPYLIGFFIGAYLISIIGVFVSSIILHIFVYLLGGRKGLSTTVKCEIYSITPTALLGWIPLIGFLVYIWSLILEIFAVRELQEMSTARAAIAVIIPCLILFALVLLAFMYFMVQVSSTVTPI